MPSKISAQGGRGGKRIEKDPAGRPAQRTADVRRVRESLGLDQQQMARLSGYSVRAIAAWEAGRPLSDSSRQRMNELARLARGLARVMKRPSIGPWLMTPNSAFSGLKPLEVVERGEVDLLWRMIHCLESGQPM